MLEVGLHLAEGELRVIGGLEELLGAVGGHPGGGAESRPGGGRDAWTDINQPMSGRTCRLLWAPYSCCLLVTPA